jgi:hypothetical protein
MRWRRSTGTGQPAKQTRTSGRPRVTARPSVYGRHTIFQIGRNDSPWGFIGPQRSEIGDRSPQAKPPTGQHFGQCPAGRSQAASDASPALRPFCLDNQFEPPTWSKTPPQSGSAGEPAAAGIAHNTKQISSPDGPIIFFWSMKGCRQMTAQEIESGIAALNAPENARVIPVSWLPRDVRTKANEYRKPPV